MNIEQFSADYLRERFDCDFDTGIVKWRYYAGFSRYWNSCYAGATVGTSTGDGHLKVTLHKVPLPLHAVIFKMYHGRDPAGEIDHRNRQRADNRIDNLREATRVEQLRNCSVRSDNTSGLRGIGIRRETGRYRAHVHIDGKHVHLGYFRTLCQAVHARRNAELKAFGAFSPKYPHDKAIKTTDS